MGIRIPMLLILLSSFFARSEQSMGARITND